MKGTRRQGWWVSLLMASAVVSGCSRGSPGPAELFLDTVVSAVAMSGKPDLWVSSVAGPSSTTPGSGYFITVKACNQGVSHVDAQVKLYLSKDTSISSEDVLVGSTQTGPLDANQCTTLRVQTRGAAGVSEGLWYLGAFIDPEDSVSEVSETNNGRAGTRMAIGSGPDLAVARVSAPARVSPSDGFETAVEVCNTGTASASADVEVYLLARADIASADKKVGSGSTGLLREGQCTTVVIPSTAEVPHGQWHVAAWVDRAKAVPELVESNNTRIGDRTVVGAGPDLYASSLGPPHR